MIYERATAEDVPVMIELLKQYPYTFDNLTEDPAAWLESRLDVPDAAYFKMDLGYVGYDPIIPGGVAMARMFYDKETFNRLLGELIKKARDFFLYGFEVLGFYKIQADELVGQRHGVFLRRLGFKLEGTLRGVAFYDDKNRDMNIYGIFREELLCRMQ